MAKPRQTNVSNVSLFPFLSILACLAGAVVVMISVLSVLQTTRAGVRANVRNPHVSEYMEAQQRFKAEHAKLEELTVMIERNEAAQRDLLAAEQRIIKLRKLLDGSQSTEEFSRALQKELELLVIQVEELQRSKPKVEREIVSLREELATRQLAPEDIGAPLKVQGSGSGFARGKHVYVVEAASDAVIVHQSAKDKLRIAAATVGADKEYDAFLEKVAADKSALLLFLVRSDGWGSYERGAGWAEAKFQIPTSKMPIPGKGRVDLSQFQSFMK